MPVSDLIATFATLVSALQTPEGPALAAVPIPGAPAHRIGKDAAGSPCLLVSHGEFGDKPAPIRLEHLLVSFDVRCTIMRPGLPPESGRFTILRCSPTNPKLFKYFLAVVTPVVSSLGPAPSPRKLRDAVSGLVELFQALDSPPTRTIQGLWSELLLICLSSDPLQMASAWHHDPKDRFDFGRREERLEVKSSGTRRREHYFSLEQLDSATGAQVVVASLFAERTGAGTTLRELYEEARSYLDGDPSLTTRFDSIVFRSLGEIWEDAMDEPFDRGLAANSLAFYLAENVPRVINPSPELLFDIRFQADMGSLKQLAPEDLLTLGGLFVAATPSARS